MAYVATFVSASPQQIHFSMGEHKKKLWGLPLFAVFFLLLGESSPAPHSTAHWRCVSEQQQLQRCGAFSMATMAIMGALGGVVDGMR